MKIPDEIAQKLVDKVDARQLLSELNNGLNEMTSQQITCTIDNRGRELGMKELIKELPRFDDWDYYLVKALKAIQKKNIAERFSKLVCKEKGFECLLVHFEDFSCLNTLNEANLSPNWKDLARKLKLTREEIEAIEYDNQFDKRFMHFVMERLAKKTLRDLLSALNKLGLTNLHDEIKNEVKLRLNPRHQSRQAQPSTMGQEQPQSDHYQQPGTSYSLDSYFHKNREEEEEKKGARNKLSSSLSTDNKCPIECTSIKSDSRASLDAIGDQENKLKEFNKVKKIETTVEGHSSSEDSKNVEATPIYSYSTYEQQVESDSNDYQYEENNLNINVNSGRSAAEEMPDVAASQNDTMNERISSDEAQVNTPYFNIHIICSGICIGGFIAYKYFRH